LEGCTAYRKSMPAFRISRKIAKTLYMLGSTEFNLY
jgi:hypothetical protein